MAISAIAIVVFIPLLLIQHFIHKKIFDPTYFNSKHYSAYELQIFTSFPLLLIKTIGYIKAIVFPNTIRRKFKNNILNSKDRPIVYFLALLTMLILIFGSMVIINTGVVGTLIYFKD